MDDDADARSSGYTQSVEEADWQHIEDVGLGLASEGTEHDDQAESKDLPFRAIDLLEGMFALRSDVAKQPRASHSLALDEPGSPALFGPPSTPSEPFHLQNVPESMQAESDESVEILEPLETHEADSLEEVQSTGPVATLQTWNELISNCFAQFREVPDSLRFPGKAGTMAAVFTC
jgi:hypothetical protein